VFGGWKGVGEGVSVVWGNTSSRVVSSRVVSKAGLV